MVESATMQAELGYFLPEYILLSACLLSGRAPDPEFLIGNVWSYLPSFFSFCWSFTPWLTYRRQKSEEDFSFKNDGFKINFVRLTNLTIGYGPGSRYF
jgi:hypothetical protein